ncbi:DUF2190 family protein [Trichormus variabilis]|uniref:DUF2190 domain-containing protein n=1 Tax=Trichormus variabilis SAG 1403-4b TaxID=447716 RepID=A0A3S1A329_ANAVA|nr:DUF2190 family protein [Trichormus variabilis]MBD2628483.1 DUF2190 family protein [Trichormus variabilis FACHB-164]RUS92513.1 hypothetical protein DSM107003_49960 [Trichormus variabilis SAG 1403-4b]
MGRKQMFVDCWVSEAAINPYRICKYGAAEGGVVQAAAATDKFLGIGNNLGASASGQRTDIVRGGIAEVEYGGTVAAGDWLTSDANGKAIATTTAGNRIIGIADVGGVSGDIGLCLITFGKI